MCFLSNTGYTVADPGEGPGGPRPKETAPHPLLSYLKGWIWHCYRNAINWTGLKAKIVQAPVVQKVDNNIQWINHNN